jgi:hypothetical protein
MVYLILIAGMRLPVLLIALCLPGPVVLLALLRLLRMRPAKVFDSGPEARIPELGLASNHSR